MKLNDFYGDVVTLVTLQGDIVGRVQKSDDTTVTLKNPRLFIQSKEGAGFVPGVSVTCQQNIEEATFNFSSILTVVQPVDEIVKSWQQMTSGIILR
mgnify:CR=1 FL=1